MSVEPTSRPPVARIRKLRDEVEATATWERPAPVEDTAPDESSSLARQADAVRKVRDAFDGGVARKRRPLPGASRRRRVEHPDPAHPVNRVRTMRGEVEEGGRAARIRALEAALADEREHTAEVLGRKDDQLREQETVIDQLTAELAELRADEAE